MTEQNGKNDLTLRDKLAIERNDLAIERNELANERTILAYARTSILAFITGLTLFKLFPTSPAIAVLAWIAFAASAVIILAGLWKYIHRLRSLAGTKVTRRRHPD